MTGARGDCSQEKFLRRLGSSVQPPASSLRYGARVLQEGRPGRGRRRVHLKTEDHSVRVPRLRRALQTFLPRTRLWHRAAAGRSSLGEEAGRPLRPRWLQLKGFVLFPFSQNKPLLRSSLCSVSAGCGPACFSDCPGVIPVGLYGPAGWRGQGWVPLVLAWLTSAVLRGHRHPLPRQPLLSEP